MRVLAIAMCACFLGVTASQAQSDQGLLTDNPAFAGSAPAVVNTPAAPGGTNAAPSMTNTQSAPAPARANVIRCNKGVLWPFSREVGDCLTDAEKQRGMTGNYKDPTGTVTTVAAANDTASTANGGSADGVAAPRAPVCTKGILWPFVRKPGDCPTDAEKEAAAKKGGAR